MAFRHCTARTAIQKSTLFFLERNLYAGSVAGTILLKNVVEMHFRQTELPKFLAYHKECCDGDFYREENIKGKTKIVKFECFECPKCKSSYWIHTYENGKTTFHVQNMPKDRPSSFQISIAAYA